MSENEIPKGPGLFGQLAKGAKGLIGGLGRGLKSLGKSAGGMIGGIASQFTEAMGMGDILSKIFEPIAAILKPFSTLFSMFTGILKSTLMPVLTNLIQTLFSPKTMALITEMATMFGNMIMPVLNKLIPVIMQLGMALMPIVEALMPIVTVIIDLITAIIQKLVESGLFDVLTKIVQVIVEVIMQLVNGLIESGLLDAIIQVVVLIADALLWLIENVIMPIIPYIVAFFKMIADAVNWLIQNAGGIWDSIVGGFLAFINFFIDMINAIVDGLNALDVFNWFADIPRLARLQEGGTVMETGPAIVHAGELVMNPEMMRAFTQAVSGSSAEKAGESRQYTTNINNPILLNDEQINRLARQIQKQAFLVS